jgi:surface polysaccharide O-acyltransferase-like enzyme
MRHASGVQHSERFLAVDGLKVLGIIGVVWIHAARSPWDPAAVPLEIWSARLAHFAVPGFLAASGFLYASFTPPSARQTARRLLRLGVPYLVASGAAQLWWWSQGQARPPLQIVEDLALGASFGPYYYVFQIFTLILLTPLLALLPRALLVPLTLASILLQLFVNSMGLPLFWALRIPFFSGGSFLLGWTVRSHHEQLLRFLVPRRSAICAVLAVAALGCAVGMTLGLPEFADRTCEWLYVNLMIVLIFAWCLGRSATADALTKLSDATCAIFLFHLFFIYAVANVRPLAPNVFDASGMLIYWLAGVAGALLCVAIARRILGERARLWVGA